MPARSSSSRVLTGTIAIAVLLTAGCQTAGSGSRLTSRADLVNELAARLDRAHELTYTAEYRLPDGKTAAIYQSQQPRRAAYAYPDGKVVVTSEATAECDLGDRPTCTLTSTPSPSSRPALAVFAKANERGLVTPPVVMGLLTAAALDANAVIDQHDTTIAGLHATCVTVSGVTDAAASSFDACITADGVLGSFKGAVDGNLVDLTLHGYQAAVDEQVFELPQEAQVIDRRPTAK
ncbi:MAG TPA: hypothetical protein VF174_13885 [Micromonosporaceae bacterium]